MKYWWDESKSNEKWEVTRVKICDNKAWMRDNLLTVVVTAHHGQRVFMESCLESVKELGWVLVTYDNPGSRYDTHFPSPKCFTMIDQFFMKHVTTEMAGPTYPQFWNYRAAADIVASSNSEYVFTIGADSILERPEGIYEIAELLGDGDIIACSTKHPERHSGPFCGTKSFLSKKQTFIDIMDFLQKDYVPFNSIGNMETRFGKAIKELKINEVIVPKLPYEDQFAHSYDEEGNCTQRGTWGEVLGYRHLAGEHKIRRLKKKKPVEEKYFAKEYLSHKEINTLLKYWKTKEWKYVEEWWKT